MASIINVLKIYYIDKLCCCLNCIQKNSIYVIKICSIILREYYIFNSKIFNKLNNYVKN